jgi:bacteriocin-like protein
MKSLSNETLAAITGGYSKTRYSAGGISQEDFTVGPPEVIRKQWGMLRQVPVTHGYLP